MHDTLFSIRPVPTRPIWCQPTAVVGLLPLADSRALRILDMFDMGSRPTITKSVVKLAESGQNQRVGMGLYTSPSCQALTKIAYEITHLSLYGPSLV